MAGGATDSENSECVISYFPWLIISIFCGAVLEAMTSIDQEPTRVRF